MSKEIKRSSVSTGNRMKQRVIFYSIFIVVMEKAIYNPYTLELCFSTDYNRLMKLPENVHQLQYICSLFSEGEVAFYSYLFVHYYLVAALCLLMIQCCHLRISM